LILLAGPNVIDNIRIRAPLNLWKLWAIVSSFKKKKSSFGLLELKIWAKNRSVSELQDRFWLLHCCQDLNLKTAELSLGLLWNF
jgi:hypothetical protein